MRSGRTTSRVLASRADHRITVDDEPEGAVALTLGDADSALRLTRAETSLHGERAVIVSGAEVEVTADRKLVLRAPQIEIAADTTLTLRGTPIKLN